MCVCAIALRLNVYASWVSENENDLSTFVLVWTLENKCMHVIPIMSCSGIRHNSKRWILWVGRVISSPRETEYSPIFRIVLYDTLEDDFILTSGGWHQINDVRRAQQTSSSRDGLGCCGIRKKP